MAYRFTLNSFLDVLRPILTNDKSATYLKLTRKYCNTFEFVAFAGLQLFTVGHEFVEQVIDNVGLEDLDAQMIGQILGVTLDFHVEGEDCGISEIVKNCKMLIFFLERRPRISDTISSKNQIVSETGLPPDGVVMFFFIFG